MNAREYLSGAYLLDQRINAKLEQVTALRTLAEKATTDCSRERVQSSKSNGTLENVVVKIVELENDIDRDIDRLVDFKRQLKTIFSEVQQPELHLLLEMRYLNYKTWEQIAEAMNYTWRNVLYLHKKALSAVEDTQSFHCFSYTI